MSDPVITAARSAARRTDLIVNRSTLLLVLLGIWWLLSLRYPHYVLPGPMRVWNALSLIVDNGDLWRNLAVTLKRVCIGFTLAAIISVPLGIMLGAIRPLGEFFEPVLPVLNTVSSAIWAIFGIIWFSISEASIIFVVFMTAMPLIITNVWQGTRAVNADFIELAHTLRMRQAADLIQTDQVFAWTITMIAMMVALESGVLKPLENHLFRWKKEAETP